MYSKRENIILCSEDGDYCITLLYPSSSSYGDKLIVIYEDAYGDVDLKIMKSDVIAKNYNVSIDEINTFIDNVNCNNK